MKSFTRFAWCLYMAACEGTLYADPPANECEIDVDEIARTSQLSKSQVRRALLQLVHAHILTFTPGEDTPFRGRCTINPQFEQWTPIDRSYPPRRPRITFAEFAAWQQERPCYDGPALTWTQARAYVLERDGFTCLYCKATGVPLHCDHITPRILGGSNHPDNLVTACVSCNAAKWGYTVRQFLDGQAEQ